MKKGKRILALIGAILLACMYLTTLILAIFENSNTMNLFMASIVATVIVPVLIWAYSMVYRLLKNHYSTRADIRSAATPKADQNPSGGETAKTESDNTDTGTDV